MLNAKPHFVAPNPDHLENDVVAEHNALALLAWMTIMAVPTWYPFTGRGGQTYRKVVRPLSSGGVTPA
jgi:hypothetical protein